MVAPTSFTSTFDYAIFLRNNGLSPIPLAPRGKRPVVKYGHLAYRPASDGELRRFFEDETRNIGVVLGRASQGLVCRDFDDLSTYFEWAAAYPDWARRLPTVRSPRAGGGRHVYVKTNLRKYEQLLRGKTAYRWPDGGHTKGPRNQIVLPPSIHPGTGMPYEWEIAPNWGQREVFPHVFDISAIGLLPSGLTQSTPSSPPPPSPPSPVRAPAPLCTSSTSCGLSKSAKGRSCSTPRKRSVRRPSAVRTSLPFPVPSSIQGFLNWAIQASLARKKGERHSKLFLLARRLKLCPFPERLTDEVLWSVFHSWLMRSEMYIGNRDVFESWREFQIAYSNADDRFGSVVMEALGRCIADGDVSIEAICRELQRWHGDRAFHLSCRLAGDLIGKSQTTAAKHLRRLVQAGRLSLVSEGVFCGQNVQSPASTYRYVFPDLECAKAA